MKIRNMKQVKQVTAHMKDVKMKRLFRRNQIIITTLAVMIAAAGYSVAKVAMLHTENFTGLSSLAGLFNLPALLLFAVLYFLYVKFKKHPIVYIAGGAIAGILLKL